MGLNAIEHTMLLTATDGNTALQFSVPLKEKHRVLTEMQLLCN